MLQRSYEKVIKTSATTAFEQCKTHETKHYMTKIFKAVQLFNR